MKLLFGATIVVSAFLLFSVEPLAARLLLPELGGSSAVWLGSLAFFQLALLLGYGYTVGLAGPVGRRPGLARLHLVPLGLAVLALAAPSPQHLFLTLAQRPQLRLFAMLGVTTGLPFLLLATTAPMLQAWYAQRWRTAVPYAFYGLSNLASLGALLLYPFVFEPHLTLHAQLLLWKASFAGYALLMGVLTYGQRSVLPLARAPVHSQTQRPVRLLWFALPAVASLQLAAVTAHLTQDIASLPLLWIVPLAAYLFSFVLAFDLPGLYRRDLVLRLLAVLLFALGYFLAEVGVNVPIGLSIGLWTAELLLATWVCHAELYALRPSDPQNAPGFYLYIAAGGAAGTLAVVVLSPLITDSNLDLPFALLLTAAVLLWVTWKLGARWRVLWAAGVLGGVALLVSLQQQYARDSLLRARNFYGALRVKQTSTPPQAFLARTLYNGNIQHGMQWYSDAFRREPLTYYARNSGVGLALAAACPASHPCRIGVIGLGAGTLAAYGRPGDSLRFYEINPLVLNVAQTLFSYTRDTPATVTLVPGDARLSLAAEPAQHFDVLAVDAFSGDSIPVHLLTREALTLYQRHLKPNGVLAFHTSNQYLDLQPVLARLDAEGLADPLHGVVIRSAADEARGTSLASWVLLTPDATLLAQPALAAAGHPLAVQADVPLWTDQRSSLLPILRWGGNDTRP